MSQLNRSAASGFDQGRVAEIADHIESTPPARRSATINVILGSAGVDAEIVSALTGKPVPTAKASPDDKVGRVVDTK